MLAANPATCCTPSAGQHQQALANDDHDDDDVDAASAMATARVTTTTTTTTSSGAAIGPSCSSGDGASGGGSDADTATATSPTSASSSSSRVSFAFHSYKDTGRPAKLINLQPAQQQQALGCPATRYTFSASNTPPPAPPLPPPNHCQEFKVHTRHRSIWRLDELDIEQPHRQPAVDHSSSKVPTDQEPRSSFGDQYKPQTLSLSYLNNRSQPRAATEPEAATIAAQDSSDESSPHHRLVTSEDEKQTAKDITMSQTLQSIHSLSMQLNRAASLSGLNQLDELIEPSGVQSPGTCRPDLSGSLGSDLGASSKLTRLVGKKTTRVKELLLQNLGKADKTTDELFKIYEEKFYKQQAQAAKLQKEFKSYIQAMKGAQDAGKSLNDFIQQSTADYQSARHDLICESLSQLEHLNEDLMDKLRGQVLISVNEYLTQFKELRAKIAKRRRKQIDFDSSRRVYEIALAAVNKKRMQQRAQQQVGGHHNHNQQQQQQTGARGLKSRFFSGAGGADDSMQTATSQLVDEARLLKLREQYNYCKIMYETINSELHEELPMVYEKKMKNLLMTLQNYFSLEAQFHSNAGKLFATSSDVIDELPISLQHSHHKQHQHQLHLSRQQHQQVNNRHEMDEEEEEDEREGDGEEEDVAGVYGNHSSAGSNKAASSSSGMGSSGGDSSSSLNDANSEANSSSPLGDDEEHDDEPAGYDVDAGDCKMESPTQVAEEEPADATAAAAARELSEPTDEVTLIDAQMQGAKAEDDGEEVAPTGEQQCEQTAPIGDQQVETKAESADGVPEAIEASGCDDDHRDKEIVVDESQVMDVKGKEIDGGALTVVPAKKSHVGAASSSQLEQMTVARCLHKVRTNYKYLAEDVDELCFEADEIIQVVEFDANQEQEDGWLMGVREVNGQRGLFPANFTRPLE